MAIKFFSSKYTWYFPALIILSVLIGGVSSYFSYKHFDREARNSLIYRVTSIALSLDQEEVAILLGNEDDIGTTPYEKLKTKLVGLQEANTDSSFVYVVGKREGLEGEEVFFYADSEDPTSEDYSPPGQVYFEESEAFDSAFSGIALTEGPVTDRWGTWISAAAPIFGEGDEVIALVGIDIDATSYKQTAFLYALVPLLIFLGFALFAFLGFRIRKKEEQIFELKSQFVAIASHELRSPLTGLKWAVESLLGEIQNEEYKKVLNNISVSVHHLLDTVGDILEMASIEVNIKKLDATTVNLRALLKKTYEDVTMSAEGKNITLSGTNLIPEDAIVSGDENALRHAFSNLISNAIKYSPQGKEVKLTYESKGRNHCIKIIDQGIGIPEAEQKKVFDGFYRATNAKKQEKIGSGLGLYLVKNVIRTHKGEVEIASKEGEGTTVIICLPKH